MRCDWITLQALFCHFVLLRAELTPLLLFLVFVFCFLLYVAVKVAGFSVADVNAVLFFYPLLAIVLSPFTADAVLVAFCAIFVFVTHGNNERRFCV